MFGATSFPSTTTPFTSGSTALAPASAPVIGATSRMTPFDSMFEVLTEVRNSVDNLGKIFAERISGLNSHLAFRLGGVYDILDLINTNIIAMGKNQETIAGIEDKKFQEFKENEQEDERSKSLGKDDDGAPGRGIINSLKDAFESFKGFFSNLMPDSDLGKVGLFGGLAALIAMNFDKLVEPLAATLKFLDEKVFPGVKKGVDTLKKDFGGEDGVLSKFFGSREDSVISSLISGFGDIIDGFKEDDPEKKIAGAKKLLLDVPLQFVSAVGLGVASIVDATLKMFGIESKFVKDTKEFFRELPETVSKFARQTKSFFTDGFADLTNSIKNIFVDIEVADGPAGAVRTQRSVIGKIKDEMLQNFKNNVQSIKDFFFDEEGNLFGINFSALADMMPTLQEIVDTIVSALPKWMRPDTLTEKLADAEADLIKAQDKLDSNPDYAPYIKKVEKAQAKVDSIKSEIETKFPSGLNEVETNNFNETFNNDVQKENTVMKEKINEIKQAENVSTSSSISQMFVDNKQVKGGDTITQVKNISYPMITDHGEKSAEHLQKSL
jgi:hypothetical protein